MAFFKPKGTSANYRPYETRRDVRRLGTRIHEVLSTVDGAMYLLMIVFTLAVMLALLPFGGEICLVITLLLSKFYMHPELKLYNFPWRVPKHAKLLDGSKNLQLLNTLNKGNVRKINPSALYGEGVTYYGICRESGLPVYATNSDDRTHLTCLGTTGSGKTEFLLGLVANQLVQNSGLIYVDAKGDPSLQRDVSRLARRFGRDDDILTINFITSGRDLVKAQPDKITNTFNMMSNTSSGMLIELLNNLLDDSGGGGGDMWKGRAMSFIGAVTRVLTYMRDKGHLQLSPSTYIRYMELSALEELVFEHDGKYGEAFDVVTAALKTYIETLPGYNKSPKARKKQEQKTLEQHGFIVMQLTRSINDLTYNYGHIFGVQQGDIDIFDCVLNRRILTIPLPALERAPDSLKMLGKLCIGSVKQMMAGSLGNRIEGLVREILDSRPTNSPNAFKLIFDEFGYIVISGTSVMPAQGRSLSFSICFAAQDFSDIKRGNENEAEAIWGNSNVKAIGRLVTGDNGDTMHKVNGVTGEEFQARAVSTDLKVGDFGDKYTPSSSTQLQKEKILPYDDLSGQENGEFTLLLSKKLDGGASAGVKIIRIEAFYVAGPPLKYLRMNDLCPNFSIEPAKIANPNERLQSIIVQLSNLQTSSRIGDHSILSINAAHAQLSAMKKDPEYNKDPIARLKVFLSFNLFSATPTEQSFVVAQEKPEQLKIATPQIAIDLKSNDAEQTQESTRLDIENMVSAKQTYKSSLEQEMVADAEEVSPTAVAQVAVKDSLSVGADMPINIFQLADYAAECEKRLKENNISVVSSETNYGLLPFVPSHIRGTDNGFEVFSSRVKDLARKLGSGSREIDDGLQTEADDLLDELQFVTQEMTSFSVAPPPDITGDASTRSKVSRLLDVINRAKSQINTK